MGILDDAIREHLELKRQHGADGDDLERLEKEAFGPATRPGDPEFVDPDATVPEAAEAAEEQAPEAPAEQGSSGFSDWYADEEATTVAPAAPSPEPPAEEAPSAEEPVPAEPSAEPEPDPTPAEQARVEHAGLGETADHPAPTQLGPEDEAERAPGEPATSAGEAEASPPTVEPEPPEAPESGIFEAGDDDGEEEDGPEPESQEEPLPPPAPASPTTDHDLPPAPVSRPAEEPPAGEPEKSAEDLLEETPDFLQETEGEDLWFEQGPPKDFDFDDNDD
jgi:hypothetical protein